MKLIIDAGNSLVKYFVFENDGIIFEKYSNRDEVYEVSNKLLELYPKIVTGIYSDVGSVLDGNDKLVNKIGINMLKCSMNIKLPFKSMYKTPETLGSDRVGLIAGASLLGQKKNKLIIDMGSCLTIDFLDQSNIHQGGYISPGYRMRYDVLKDSTADLPKLQFTHSIDSIGDSTDSSIHAGIHFGIQSEIKSYICKFKKDDSCLMVIATGGNVDRLNNSLKSKIFVDCHLQARGLNYLLDYNT